MKKECKIVQDLLPNYLEKVTNAETNEFIENHIKECEECKKVYSSMQYDINVEKIDTEEEVDYMKKFKKKFKIMRNILLLIVIIFVIIVLRKMIILNNLDNTTKKYYDEDNCEIIEDYYMNLNNYYAKAVVYQKEKLGIMESYCKDGNKLATIDIYFYEENGKHIRNIDYYKDGERIRIEQDVTNNTVSNNEIGVNIGVQTSRYFTLNEYLEYLVFASIHKVNFEGKECYLIKKVNEEKFIDIKTGTIKRIVSYEDNIIVDYYYEFGTVTDEDIKRPEIEE